MHKKALAAIVLALLSGLAQAEAWLVDVSLSYVNSKVKAVVDIPVLNFTVPVGECVKGKTRTEDMIPKPIKVTQEICVTKDGDKTEIKGWVFATDRINDPIFKETRGQLNYGQPVNLQTDGGYVKAISGHFTIEARRSMPIAGAGNGGDSFAAVSAQLDHMKQGMVRSVALDVREIDYAALRRAGLLPN